MHELKVARSQALTTREMAQIGLFTALIAAGAYIKINIPVQPFPMHFTMQFLFVLLAGFLLGARRGCNLCGDLSGGRPFRYSGVCGRWRSCLSDPSNIRIFNWALYLLPGSQESCPPSPGSRYCLGSVQCLLGDDGLLCFMKVYFYGISNYVIHMPISWKLVVINCFLITVVEDFLLCVMAAFLAKRIRALAGDMFQN